MLKAGRRPRLVVIDPISAYLSSTDSHNNAEVRALLAPLAALAERHRVAVVAINHLNKGGGGKAIYRSMGSLAFIAAARAGWLIARSHEDPQRRLMLVAKMNVAKEPTGLSYRIIDGRIVWDAEPVTMTADQALSATLDPGLADAGPKLSEAVALVNSVLADGEVAARDLQSEARAQGISDATLRRARSLVGVRQRRVGGGAAHQVLLSRLSDPPPAGEPPVMFPMSPLTPAHAPA
jgi:hypothetical protein